MSVNLHPCVRFRVGCLVFGVSCFVFRCLGFRVWCLVFRVYGLVFGVWGFMFRFWCLGFRVESEREDQPVAVVIHQVERVLNILASRSQIGHTYDSQGQNKTVKAKVKTVKVELR